jgi:RHS repeat-associated protein
LGQLTSDGTYTYTYTDSGNLLTVKQNGTTVKSYGYDGVWTDQLVYFNGNLISYNLAGDPINYYDGTRFTWYNGHELWSLQKGSTSATYTYDAYGKRIQKTVNGTATNYYYDEADNLFAAGNVFIFYGPNGEAMSIKYNGTRYYLVKNLQGDVIALADTTGALVAQYTYDAWGKPLTITDGNGTNVANNATHIANLNPLRYRSYVYDNESGFYYLMSRYYDPTTGRFLSPDSQLNLSTMYGCNLYAYCENDPVNYVDPTGHSAILALFVITAVSGFFACASPAGQARTEEAFSDPSFYSIGNWLTMGAFGMVKGAVAPAQPFSAQHWIDSAGTAMLLMPAIGFADDVARNTKTNANSYTSRGVNR